MQSTAAFGVGNLSHGKADYSVSRQWLARPADQKFLSLSALKSSVSGRRERSLERRIDTRKLELFGLPNPSTVEMTHDLYLGVPGGDVANHLQADYISVYVPTTPNPTSGFFLMVRKADAIELDMSVDEALKYIVSMGVVAPPVALKKTS